MKYYNGFYIEKITCKDYIVIDEEERAMPDGVVSFRTMKEAKAYIDRRNKEDTEARIKAAQERKQKRIEAIRNESNVQVLYKMKWAVERMDAGIEEAAEDFQTALEEALRRMER